jgi:hypothetical protein
VITIEDRLMKIEAMLIELLIERQQVREWYSIEEFARLLGNKAEFTVRRWARLGRIRAEKRLSGRGSHMGWCISHQEFLRFQREGLLPLKDALSCDEPL